MFVAAAAVIVVWMLSGSFLGYSDTWQLIINTLTTLITFLMVFIIQNTQNRGTAAIHLKLDTLMRRLEVQDADLYDAENRSEAELEAEDQRIVPPGARRPDPPPALIAPPVRCSTHTCGSHTTASSLSPRRLERPPSVVPAQRAGHGAVLMPQGIRAAVRDKRG